MPKSYSAAQVRLARRCTPIYGLRRAEQSGSLRSIITLVEKRMPATGGIGRRAVLAGALGFGARAALQAGQDERAARRPAVNDVLVKVGDSALNALTADDIPLQSAPVEAWAMEPGEKIVRSGSRLNKILIVKLDPESLSAATRPLSAGGVIAYTAICTHEGCDIGGWIAAEHLLYCECHESKFDPRDLARVVDGPAPRNLPALPLKVVDGLLIVAKPFTARVGGESA
jgi:rieske iron-sulfur protein